jgi:exo-1,4-beta-D-glucosaminidase
MFMLESGAPSVPPMDSLSKFIPDLDSAPDSDRYPLTPAWAHHDACHYFKPFDDAVRRIFGRPKNVVDYCRKAAVLSADQHRAMYEAANHRMWDITSGVSEWKLNAAWPSVEWQIYDWFLKPMPSFYYIRKACEPLHVQLTPLDSMVSIINHRLEAQNGLEVVARVYEADGKLRWEKSLKTDVPTNSCKEVCDVPPATAWLGGQPIYFVKLQLKDARGAVVSDNFYWLPSRHGTTHLSRQEDLAALETLPPVTLRSSMTTQTEGAETVARVKLENPGKQLAFFVHAAITRGAGGEEIVPVFWNDNYISLAPGEVRELTARFATADAGNTQPALEVGGWNVESRFKCASLRPSKSRVKAGEPFTVTAMIADTFLDGSRVALVVDGQPADAQWTWARGNKRAEVAFKPTLREPGTHRLTVAGQTAAVVVE